MIPSAHPNPQRKRHLDQFSHFCTDDCRVSLHFTIGCPFSPSKLLLPMGGSGPLSNPWFLGRTRVLNPNAFSRFCRAHYCDRPTDYATRLVTIGLIYVRSTAILTKTVNNLYMMLLYIVSHTVSE